MGPMGPMGPQGPQGEKGDAGVTMAVIDAVFPPPGQIRLEHPAVKRSSVLIPIYTEISNGNAIGIASQSNGSFVATGSPNKPFKVIILNAN